MKQFIPHNLPPSLHLSWLGLKTVHAMDRGRNNSMALLQGARFLVTICCPVIGLRERLCRARNLNGKSTFMDEE
jgi:hypothetical protein